jgi:hypothetical protein
VAGANSNFEGVTRLDNTDPALRQHALMEKGVAGTIGEFDKAKPLRGVPQLNREAPRYTPQSTMLPGRFNTILKIS